MAQHVFERGQQQGLVRPVEVRSVADVVNQYYELIAILSAAAPSGTFVGPSGTSYTYRILIDGRD